MKIVKTSIIIFLLAVISAYAADWPNFLGPDKNNVSQEKGINKDWKKKTPKKLWEISLGDNGYSGPCVTDGKMFIIDHQGDKEVVRAIDIKTGKQIWTYKYSDTKKENWGYGRTTPLYENGLLYTLGRMGDLNCLDAKTGKKKWGYNIVERYKGSTPRWQIAISPVIDGNNLIVCPGGNKGIVALNKIDGKLIWQGGNSDSLGYSTPVVKQFNGKKQYIVFTGNNLIGVDPEKGNVLWKYGWKTKYDVNSSTPIIIDDKHVFISSAYKHGAALLKVDGKKVSQVWFKDDIELHWSTAILINGNLYAAGNSGFKCIEAKTGKIIWDEKKYGKSGPLLVDGVFLVVNDKNGDLMMVQAGTKFKELNKMSALGKGSWSSPVLSDKKLYIRDLKKLICLDMNP